MFSHCISYLTSWIANKISSLFLFFFHSKSDVQWCYLLVDCQIGWSCFSHFFSLLLPFPTRPQSTSGRFFFLFFGHDDSASKKKHTQERERSTATCYRHPPSIVNHEHGKGRTRNNAILINDWKIDRVNQMKTRRESELNKLSR